MCDSSPRLFFDPAAASVSRLPQFPPKDTASPRGRLLHVTAQVLKDLLLALLDFKQDRL